MSQSSPVLRRAQDTILRWKANPVAYVTEVLGVKPEPWQVEALTALAVEDRISIRSGHGVGKSALDAWIILWFLSTRYPAKVAAAAPTQHQIQDVLWAELGMWHRRMPQPLRDQFGIQNSQQAMRFYLIDAPGESFAVGRSGNRSNPEALQGFHSDNMLFLLDEASGIDDIVFEVAGGALSTKGSKILMTANPTRSSGYFYNSHHSSRDQWHTMVVSCHDSSRVDASYPEQMAKEYGIDSNVYRVRVLGEFPTADDNVLIPLELVEAARCRDVDVTERLAPVWGLDVARFGDCRTALAKRQGNTLLSMQSWAKRDLMEVSGILNAEYEDTPSHLRPAEIMIDAVGLGAGVLDRCREMRLPVRGINVGETASGRDKYANLKAELWYRARDWFDAKDCRICDSDTLIGQLCTVQYSFSSSGKLKIEGKEDMQKRGLRSPDEADAFILTFAGGTKRIQEDRYKQAEHGRRKHTAMSR